MCFFKPRSAGGIPIASPMSCGRCRIGRSMFRLKSWPQKFYPSLAHTEEDIDRTIEAFKKVAPTLRG